MDSNKENNLIYVTAKQVEKATGLSKMTVSRNCRANKYQYREVSGNGGIRREILLSSLEPENQDKVRRFLEIESFTNGTTGINNACEVLPLDKNVVPFLLKKTILNYQLILKAVLRRLILP